ncbi:MAG: hypothetical protein KatS3mg077_1814 [Candidatus Binatia bacterium]|nr:MAG: hypothetical protein KatS3mg077_1814 [Candidatus Binatia bacterium]
MPQAPNQQDNLTHLLQPDSLLPAQYFAALRRRLEHEPERCLVVALLQDAVECFQKHLFARDRKKRQLFRDAEEWISSTDRTWPFSFENVCEQLELDPEYIRKGLFAWKAAQLARGCAERDAAGASTPPASRTSLRSR